MAKIWPVREGRKPTSTEPWAELPLSAAINLFELREEDFVSGLDQPPRFGDTERDLWYADYRYIVIEVDVAEARRQEWQPGFYKSSVNPREGFRRLREYEVGFRSLLEYAFVSELGKKNVVRVEHAPTIDSRGEAALLVTVVITPNAIRNFAPGATLDALVKLHERLGEIGDERTPIVEYATEAELAESAGH